MTVPRTSSKTFPPNGPRCLPTGYSSTSPTGTRPWPRFAPSGLEPLTSLVRRGTLEDVFLRLTGRRLED